MTTVIKHFNELTTEELYRIYKLRVSVFVVEQSCPYQEVDDFDRDAYHLWFEEDGEIIAYLRILPAGTAFDTAAIGRVISMRRRCGIGRSLVKLGMETAEEKLGAEEITLEAQVYARGLYEGLGFEQCSEEFFEDGIPHIRMRYKKIRD